MSGSTALRFRFGVPGFEGFEVQLSGSEIWFLGVGVEGLELGCGWL